MGTICSTKCNCGYKTRELYLGGGMLDFTTRCDFPYYCKECSKLFIGNIYNKNINCSECGSFDIIAYNKKEMVSSIPINKEDIREETISFPDKLSLTNEKYLCPKCKKYELEFSFIGNWD